MRAGEAERTAARGDGRRGDPLAVGWEAVGDALARLDEPCHVVAGRGTIAATSDLERARAHAGRDPDAVLASLPALPPEQLGDPGFRTSHGVRIAYLAGSMANGISGPELVGSLGAAGILSSLGTAGLSPADVDTALGRLREALPHGPYAVNLIHTPDDPRLEDALVELYLRRGVRTVEASAFMGLTPAIVAYRAARAQAGAAGANRVLAKVSRREVAAQFMSPPPEPMLRELVVAGRITAEQARLAAELPVADDVTVEADSAGHTDGQPLVCHLPALVALRDELGRRHGFAVPVRLGAGGGISTPASVAAAFVLGADYVVTGSVNQGCVEAATSDAVKGLLAQAEPSDVAMAPAADMFELGVRVQVLKRGTLFAMRAQRLYELYRTYPSVDALPARERERLEHQLFRKPLDEVWADTQAYLLARAPDLLARARDDEHLRLALVLRWYLGRSSDWATRGEPGREADYQIWCGPAMGAFNAWVSGSHLADPRERRAADVASNLMTGAAHVLRVQSLRAQGVSVPPEVAAFAPRRAVAPQAPDVAAHAPRRAVAVPAAPQPPEVAALAVAVPAAPQPPGVAALAVAVPAAPQPPGVAALAVAAPAPAPGREEIEAWLVAELAAVLAVAADEIDPRLEFASYAISSAQAMAILARLERRLGRRLSSTLVWNYPTIAALAERLGATPSSTAT